MFEDFGTACKNFQNLAVDLVERLQSQTPCTESGPFNCIMLDQSQVRGRIFLNPTRFVREPPMGFSSSPPPPCMANSYEEGCLQKLKNSQHLRTSTRADCDPRLSDCGEAEASACAAHLQLNQCLSDQNRSEILCASLPEEVYDVLRASEDEFNQAAEDYLYEDADDVEAFLGCSDEEGSITGNAPSSELTYHYGLADEVAGPCELPSRKRGFKNLDEEVDSRFNKRQRSQEELDDEVGDIADVTCSSSVSFVDGFSGDSPGPFCSQDDDNEGAFQELDESAIELQILCDEIGFELTEDQQCSSCSEEYGEEGDAISSGSARKSRRDKIKQTVKDLSNMIPGLKCMDTVTVLDETIHYVKLLQLVVQEALEAKRLVERK